jgi:hypothetical protein
MNNDKKIILNKVITICMEIIWSILILVGVLVLLAETEYFCAILAGVAMLASIGMILIDFNTLKILLDDMELDSIRDYINKK